jgi:hypothetical protein
VKPPGWAILSQWPTRVDTTGYFGHRRQVIDVASSAPSIYRSAARYRFGLPLVPQYQRWASPTLCYPGPPQIWPATFFQRILIVFFQNMRTCKICRKLIIGTNWVLQISVNSLDYYLSSDTGCM